MYLTRTSIKQNLNISFALLSSENPDFVKLSICVHQLKNVISDTLSLVRIYIHQLLYILFDIVSILCTLDCRLLIGNELSRVSQNRSNSCLISSHAIFIDILLIY